MALLRTPNTTFELKKDDTDIQGLQNVMDFFSSANCQNGSLPIFSRNIYSTGSNFFNFKKEYGFFLDCFIKPMDQWNNFYKGCCGLVLVFPI